jgi:hypothetical protein
MLAQYKRGNILICRAAEPSYAVCAAVSASVITASEAAKTFTNPSLDMLPPTTNKSGGSI